MGKKAKAAGPMIGDQMHVHDGLNPHPVDLLHDRPSDIMEQALPDSVAKVDQEEQEQKPEIKPCAICGGTAFIKCPTCLQREKGGEKAPPALAEGESCSACEGEGVVPCPICFQKTLAQMPKPVITIEFIDPLSAQFTVRMEGFHPALVTAQVMLVAEFLKVRAQWDQHQRFNAELSQQRGRQKMIQDLTKGVPMGGLPGIVRAK